MMQEAQYVYKQGQQEDKQEVPLVLMRIPQILEIMPISRATFCSMVKKGEFPKPIKIGRSSLWTQEQVQAYMRQKIKETGY
jgi:prophage regulatory protein